MAVLMMNGAASVRRLDGGQRVVDRAGFRRALPFWPTPLVRLPCGSTSTQKDASIGSNAKDAARLMVVVVFPTPPFDWQRRQYGPRIIGLTPYSARIRVRNLCEDTRSRAQGSIILFHVEHSHEALHEPAQLTWCARAALA